MFIITGGTIVGAILGALVLIAGRQKPAFIGWFVLGSGAFALMFILPGLLSILLPFKAMFSPAFTIAAGVACLVAGIGGVVKKFYRGWQIWLGLAMGAIPVLFWVFFIAAEILYPHN